MTPDEIKVKVLTAVGLNALEEGKPAAAIQRIAAAHHFKDVVQFYAKSERIEAPCAANEKLYQRLYQIARYGERGVYSAQHTIEVIKYLVDVFTDVSLEWTEAEIQENYNAAYDVLLAIYPLLRPAELYTVPAED